MATFRCLRAFGSRLHRSLHRSLQQLERIALACTDHALSCRATAQQRTAVPAAAAAAASQARLQQQDVKAYSGVAREVVQPAVLVQLLHDGVYPRVPAPAQPVSKARCTPAVSTAVHKPGMLLRPVWLQNDSSRGCSIAVPNLPAESKRLC